MTGLMPAFRSIASCEVVPLRNARSGWQAFLDRADLDAVAIAVPPEAQYHIAKRAIQRGLHIFAEKPLAANLEQAKELCALATENEVVHCVDFMFPEIPQWQEVKHMLDGDALGPCRHITVEWTWLSGDLRYGRSTWRTSVREGGGVLSLYFSHGLHYLEHFVGEMTDASCVFTYSPRSANGGEVGVDMLLKFVDGATGCVHVSSNSRGRVTHRLVFECEHGVIVLENRDAVVDDFHVRSHTDAGEQVLPVRSDAGRPGEDERAKIVRRVAQGFIDACSDKGRAHPSFEHGVRVHELIELLRSKAVHLTGPRSSAH